MTISKTALAEVCRAVREELLLAGLTSAPRPVLPLPHDIDAERAVCSALLCGLKRLDLLEGLEPAHFYVPLHAMVYATALGCIDEGLPPRLSFIEAALAEQGCAGHGVHEALVEIEAVPFVAHVDAHAARIIAAAEARALIERLQRLEVDLRTGTKTAAEAVADLRRPALSLVPTRAA